MKTSRFLRFLGASIVAASSAPLAALEQDSPEIVWSTNGQDFIYAVNFSADGRFLATAADDTQVKVWSVADHALVRTFSVGGAAALSVAISPDGSLVAAGDGDGGIRLWRMADGVRLWRNTPAEDPINFIAFSSDGNWLVDARSSRFLNLLVHRVSDGLATVLTPDEPLPPFLSATFTPDDLGVLSGSQNSTAQLWRIADRSLVRTFSGHADAVHSVEISRDGSLLATASVDGTARLWRVADGSVVRVIEGGGGSAAKFAADGQLLLTLNGGPISLWRVSTGQWLHTYTNANATALAVAPDGEHFAYGRSDGSLVLARLPLWITQISYQDFAITLRWEGGSGRYQVQARSSLSSGDWQNLGAPTTNSFFSHVCISPMFYRVQSLTNAP